MRLLATLESADPPEPKSIELYEGDLAAIPAGEEVDLLVVSAFPDSYAPTPRSLIGALYRKGLSVARLALEKELDLRDELSCWISRDLTREYPGFGFRRILCFEPLFRGRPAEVGDVFQSMMALAMLGDPPVRTIAMPLLASGEQRADPLIMLAAIIDAAVQWMDRGLPISTLKIVERSWGTSATDPLPSILRLDPDRWGTS
ncbi:MAG TPA: hypothetical protein VF746_07650 [Longimicrobium sp.]|jgi:hypothetical protein